MKTKSIFSVLFFVAIPLFASNDKLTNENFGDFVIGDIPQMDCSVSLQPISRAIAAELLGYPYEWKANLIFDGSKYIEVNYKLLEQMPSYDDRLSYKNKTASSLSSGAIKKLTDKTADIIFIARSLTQAEKDYATSLGIEILEKPICKDALTFVINDANKVDNLSVEQIQKIYTGEIKNWAEVGGEDAEIEPLGREEGTACQEAMRNIVMDGLNMIDCSWQELQGGGGPFYGTYINPYAIGFMTNYHFDNIAPDNFNPKEISINNVLADKNTIADATAPLLMTNYVAIRSDLDPASLAYKIYEYVTTAEGKELLSSLGYTPISDVTDIQQVVNNELSLCSNNNTLTITTASPAKRITIADISGKIILTQSVKNNTISTADLKRGCYIVSIDLADGTTCSKKLILE